MRATSAVLLGLASVLRAAAPSTSAKSGPSAATKGFDGSKGIDQLPSCPATRNAAYDYIVVGAGAGGGTTAARLAANGWKVLLVDAGPDHVNVNTTIPLYLLRATEDPEIELGYEVQMFPPNDKKGRKATNWYPRAQGLGGCTIHNALINQIPHVWDMEQVQNLFGDDSWSADNMATYYTRIENNQYIPKNIGVSLSHGYTGWLYTQAPASNLVTDPQYHDQKLADLVSGTEGGWPVVPNSDWTTMDNDLAEGGGIVPITINPNLTRHSVRDHLVETQAANPKALTFQLSTLATKILTCREKDGSVKAYGVETAPHQELPISPKFSGTKYNVKKQKFTNFYANNEIIVSTGAYQTPPLLMLSGIGNHTEIENQSITPLVNLPGVGQNLQDRQEMTIVWLLNTSYTVWNGCTFGSDPTVDPCLKAWQTDGHSNLYESGPAIWAHSYKTKANLPYRDMWSMYGPGSFRGYYPGWGQENAALPNGWTDVILKGHTSSKGWVRLTGNHPQDLLDINKNLGQTPEDEADVTAVVNEVKASREFVKNTPLINQWISSELYPGKDVSTDQEIFDFIEKEGWGHHACCTAKIGTASDQAAVVNNNFQVYGVDALRIVDNSVWANIPGFFVTTPIYMIGEKAADVIIEYATAQGWKPSALAS